MVIRCSKCGWIIAGGKCRCTMGVIEGKERKGGKNPPPLNPKPNIAPPPQGGKLVDRE